ncbi:MAG: sigma-70 family RNA polymerase sigma factor [Verrucomicrobiales bacterium]
MSADPNRDFVSLLAKHDRALTLYVYSLVPRQSDADDILQQSKLTMWENFAKFTPGTNFLAWSRKIAFHKILNYRRKSKNTPIPLENDVLEQLGESVAALSEHETARREALESCLHRLKKDHRRLIILRYHEDSDIEELAEKFDSTPTAIYRSLSRLRMNLADCIRQRLTGSATA